MIIESTSIPGLLKIPHSLTHDSRGYFAKLFESQKWKETNLPTKWDEVFVTNSKKNVLRGMHYQEPPVDHVKLVTVLEGVVLDVALDIRVGEKTYGGYYALEVSGDEPVTIVLPKGLAHGFFVKSNHAIVLYHTTSIHVPQHDKGIRWDSFGFSWPEKKPLLSDRDCAHPDFHSFKSPFI